jgi:uncharacterized membrane protein YadS
MIILINFFIEITCVKSVTAEINLITKNYLEIGILFLNFFINLFDLYGIANGLMVCDAHNLMTQFNRIVD